MSRVKDILITAGLVVGTVFLLSASIPSEPELPPTGYNDDVSRREHWSSWCSWSRMLDEKRTPEENRICERFRRQ